MEIENHPELKDIIFFKDEKGVLTTYINSKGVKCVSFGNERKRQICIEQFLAFHSFEIGNNINEEGNILYLSFNGDLEIYDAMLNPKKYLGNIVWKKDFDTAIFSSFLEELKGVKFPFTPVIVHVNQFDDEKVLYLSAFRVNTFELYTEAMLPWVVQNKYNQPMTVFLSRYQKEIFYGLEEKDEKIKVDYYLTEKGLEPIILDQNKKNYFLNEILNKVFNYMGKDFVLEQNKIIVLEFKNGDRDILSALIGSIKYKYYEIADIETFKDKEYYEKLNNHVESVLILTYIPGTDKLLYYGIVSKK